MSRISNDKYSKRRQVRPAGPHADFRMVAAIALIVGGAMSGPAYSQLTTTPPANTFQSARVNDAEHPYQNFPCDPEAVAAQEKCESTGGGGPALEGVGASMTAVISNITVNGQPAPGTGGMAAGIIGGDVLEFDVTITNTSSNANAVLTAYAFQSKFSESPALASRIGDKLFSAVLTSGGAENLMTSVKKNGTSNGLFTGKWKGICINSSLDFIPEFNSSLEDESLECAGSRQDLSTQDADGNTIGPGPDGNPELAFPLKGLYPGQSQTVRLRLDSGTTDGAAHRVPAGTLTGTVQSTTITGPNGVTYMVPSMVAGSGNVTSILDFGDNKVLRAADGSFDPSFAPAAQGFSVSNVTALTFPRVNFAFTDLLGRNHTCATYGLNQGQCASPGSPLINLLGTGDLMPGIQNFAAILQGFGEFHDPNLDFTPDPNPADVLPDGSIGTRPSQPYNVLCENCGGIPYVPVAEFYVPNADGQTVTRQIAAGTYGTLGSADQYTASIGEASKLKQETICIATNREFEIPEEGAYTCATGSTPSGPKPKPAFGATAEAHFHDLQVFPGGTAGAGLNGGDAIQFSVTIHNTSPADSGIYLTSFNYQTKRRGLADINILDGTSQDRRDVRLDLTLPQCTSLDDEACINLGLTNGNGAAGVGQFPNVIGNGLLFGQMVWPSADVGREPDPVDSDQVFVDTTTGIPPTPFWLESVKKNGPFTPILKGNVNFICMKSGLFLLDPDADAACAGQSAELVDPNIDPIPSNVTQRLGIPPGGSQTIRMRMDFGDFRGVLFSLAPNTLEPTLGSPVGELFRFFDCSDQRELEFCHPGKVGDVIGYLPNTTAQWQTPASLQDVRFVIANQPGDAARVMNFAQNFAFILRMAGFKPSAEFYKPDENPELASLTIGGNPVLGVLVREQVIGEYTRDLPGVAPTIVTAAVTSGAVGQPYSYDVNANAYPAATYSLDTAPTGMTINSATGLVSWTPTSSGTFAVAVRASNATNPDAVQSFQLTVPGLAGAILDDFNRRNSLFLTGNWIGSLIGYRVTNNKLNIGFGGPVIWKNEYGPSQEASIVLSKIDLVGRRHALLLKSRLLLDGIRVSYLPKGTTPRIEIEARPNLFSNWQRLASVPIRLSNGTRLTARAMSDGTVSVLANGQVIATANAGGQFASRRGHIGLWYEIAPNAQADDFGGGNLGNSQISMN